MERARGRVLEGGGGIAALRSIAACAALAAVLASLALAATASAHGGARSAAPEGQRATVQLRKCWMTVAYVPRPAAALQRALPTPEELDQTFYGADPLLGVWAVSCARGQVAGERVRQIVLSVVAVPVGLTVPGAPPLANFFAHALIRADTNSRPLAAALRRARLPARLARSARYRHSRPGLVPFTGALEVPGRYRVEVSASAPDPTNPHQHSNTFSHRDRSGRTAQLVLATGSAFDRFCFPASGGCRATVGAPAGSALATLLGARSAQARAGFDHARVARLDLALRAPM